jgi:magnesium chelatase subunit D
VWIEKDDLRVKRMSRKAGVLTVFAVDASGSMALHRAAVAKGAALTLLEAAHKRRDSVAVVSYGGAFATTLLPPSCAPALARARLAAIPSGGGTPLAHGLVTAGRVAHDAAKFRAAVASSKVVLLTDGGANVLLETSLAAERRARDAGASAEEDTTRRKDDASETSQKRVSVTSEVVPSKAALRSEALAIAALIIKRSGARLLVVDASRRFERAEPEKSAVGKDPATESLPRALARAARGAYYRLAPTADARRAGETLAGVVDA